MLSKAVSANALAAKGPGLAAKGLGSAKEALGEKALGAKALGAKALVKKISGKVNVLRKPFSEENLSDKINSIFNNDVITLVFSPGGPLEVLNRHPDVVQQRSAKGGWDNDPFYKAFMKTKEEGKTSKESLEIITTAFDESIDNKFGNTTYQAILQEFITNLFEYLKTKLSNPEKQKVSVLHNYYSSLAPNEKIKINKTIAMALLTQFLNPPEKPAMATAASGLDEMSVEAKAAEIALLSKQAAAANIKLAEASQQKAASAKIALLRKQAAEANLKLAAAKQQAAEKPATAPPVATVAAKPATPTTVAAKPATPTTVAAKPATPAATVAAKPLPPATTVAAKPAAPEPVIKQVEETVKGVETESETEGCKAEVLKAIVQTAAETAAQISGKKQ
jgi:hypothetical protein